MFSILRGQVILARLLLVSRLVGHVRVVRLGHASGVRRRRLDLEHVDRSTWVVHRRHNCLQLLLVLEVVPILLNVLQQVLERDFVVRLFLMLGVPLLGPCTVAHHLRVNVRLLLAVETVGIPSDVDIDVELVKRRPHHIILLTAYFMIGRILVRRPSRVFLVHHACHSVFVMLVSVGEAFRVEVSDLCEVIDSFSEECLLRVIVRHFSIPGNNFGMRNVRASFKASLLRLNASFQKLVVRFDGRNHHFIFCGIKPRVASTVGVYLA